jgi:hypothetical protein
MSTLPPAPLAEVVKKIADDYDVHLPSTVPSSIIAKALSLGVPPRLVADWLEALAASLLSDAAICRTPRGPELLGSTAKLNDPLIDPATNLVHFLNSAGEWQTACRLVPGPGWETPNQIEYYTICDACLAVLNKDAPS